MSIHINLQSINPCQKCKSSNVFCEQTLDAAPKYFVLCHECSFSGVECPTYREAVSLWNFPKPPPKPLRGYKDY